MSKPLSHQELHVLQDNFDLFSDTPNQDKKAEPVTTKASTSKTHSARGRRKQKTTPPLQPSIPKSSKEGVDDNKSTSHNKPKAPSSASKLNNLHPNDKGASYLAIRATSIDTAIRQLKEMGVTVDNYAMEKREVTLKNIADALLDRGLKYRVDKCTLHWVLTSENHDTQALDQQDPIELSINKAWFDTQKLHIRRLKGIAYLDACVKIAQQIPLKFQTNS